VHNSKTSGGPESPDTPSIMLRMPEAQLPVVLCLSGHDPSGGAGIQADIEAVRAQGAHPATVITALTVQDSRNAYAVVPLDPQEMLAQAELLLEDLPVAAIKLGMLGSAGHAVALASLLRRHPALPLVFDPVLRAGGGAALADQALVDAMLEQLLPLTFVLTPNAAEARALAHAGSDGDCARWLLSRGARHVLVTGGDEPGDDVCNHLYGPAATRSWRWPRLPHRYHGSGCTLAAALAARLALGMDVEAAADAAQTYTWQTLAAAYAPGRGQHFPRRL
jgi:hydroxymethylpyrimidine/phosphomethylpyrimidine kinase